MKISDTTVDWIFAGVVGIAIGLLIAAIGFVQNDGKSVRFGHGDTNQIILVH